MDPVITILRETKERLFEKGWHKGLYGQSDGPNCILGALLWGTVSNESTFLGPLPKDQAISIRLLDELSPCLDVVTFNDHEDTSFDDIVDLIDLAIKTQESLVP